MKRALPTLILTLLLTACGTSTHLKEPPKRQLPPPPAAEATFQFNQSVKLQLLETDRALMNKFVEWANSGVYSNAPVYRQLPGIFVLAGKPRLKGATFVPGILPTPLPKNKQPKEASSGYAGLIIHADGTVGPELILTYGTCLRAWCEHPANIRIAKIVEGKSDLKTIARGDNLLNITITQP